MKTFSITDIGKHREMNQDYMFTSEKPVGNLPNLFLVADGMGGHKAGDFASRFTVETLVQTIANQEETDPQRLLNLSIQYTNGRLLEEARNNPEMTGMGTTLVALTILEDHFLVANVGDSRLYVISDEILQITEDHSFVQEMVRIGELGAEEAKSHCNKNIITRAIGAETALTVDFFEGKLEAGDEILMCTDGLTNMIEDEEIRQIVKGQRDVAEKAVRLVQKANENGGKDNITVVMIEPFVDEVKAC